MSGWHRRVWDAEGLFWLISAGLAPAEWAFRLGTTLRARAYDRGWLRSSRPSIATIVVGNLTVGGTGKTPLTAWIAARLQDGGARPAVVMRGYGGDEVAVHRLLNPAVPVHVSADRHAGLREALSEGARLAVLDDAFQHRAVRADASVVLVSADEWERRRRLLPRGPWRESLDAIGRATMAVVTRKAAPAGRAEEIAELLGRSYPELSVGRVHLRLTGRVSYTELQSGRCERRPLEGARFELALAGVAHPQAFFRQLEQAGASVTRCLAFPDHRRYGRNDLKRIRREARGAPVVMTLKDAVKLGPALGGDNDVQVALQEVVWEAGADAIDRVLVGVMAGREPTESTT